MQNTGGSAYGTSVAVDAKTGNIAVVGIFSGPGGTLTIPSFSLAGLPSQTLTSVGGADTFVASLDGTGRFLWADSFGIPSAGQAVEALAVAMFQGDLFITGNYSENVAFGGYQLTGNGGFVAKLLDGQNGTVAWAYTLPWGSGASGNAIGVDSQGDVVVTGQMNDSGSIIVTKYSAGGQVQWSSPFGNDLTHNTMGQSIAVGPDDDVVLTGQFGGSIELGAGGPTIIAGTGPSDAFVAKLDGTTGSAQWAYSFSSTGEAFGQSVVVDSASNVFVGGSFTQTTANGPFNNLNCPGVGTGSADTSGFLVSFDQAGNCRWSKAVQMPSNNGLIISALALDASGKNLLVAGDFGSSPGDELNFCGQMPLVAAGGDAMFLSEISTSIPPSCTPGGMALPFGGPEVYPGGPAGYAPGALVVNPFGGIVVAGTIQQPGATPVPVDFGSGPLVGAPKGDVFLASLGPPPN
jgi:hypothetical protein